ncbi:hypothetical protein, partial [Streptomyces sp. NPDC059378]|uniref:hypothetical protein n=1 Tax=Streptomyces sp. NPDC059378 TaxID=3346815 RepID=UPI0036876CC5
SHPPPARARCAEHPGGGATTDPAIHGIVVDMTDRMRAMLREAVTAWLVKVEHHEPAEARERSVPIAHRVMALYQAELLYTALRTPTEETAS